MTNNPNGTVTLAVYRKDGIAGANAKLHELGDSQVYVVPVGAGCPSMSSLPAPAVPLNGKHLSVQSSVSVGGSAGRSVTVNAKGIPAGDILVVAVETTTTGNTTTSLGAGKLTTAPAPSCVSLPSTAGSDFGWGSGKRDPGPATAGPVRAEAPEGEPPRCPEGPSWPLRAFPSAAQAGRVRPGQARLVRDQRGEHPAAMHGRNAPAGGGCPAPRSPGRGRASGGSRGPLLIGP